MPLQLDDVKDIGGIYLHEAEEGWYWVVHINGEIRISERFYDSLTKAFINGRYAHKEINKGKEHE